LKRRSTESHHNRDENEGGLSDGLLGKAAAHNNTTVLFLVDSNGNSFCGRFGRFGDREKAPALAGWR
jgi:hypothetical protein